MTAVAAFIIVVACGGLWAAWRRRLVYRSFDPARLTRHRAGWSLALIFAFGFGVALPNGDPRANAPSQQVAAGPTFPSEAYARAHAEDRVLAARRDADERKLVAQHYVEGVGRQIVMLGYSIKRVNQLLQAPAILDGNWRLRLGAEILAWNEIYKMAAREAPPAGFEQMHEGYVAALRRMRDDGEGIMIGVARLELGRVSHAVDRATADTEQINAWASDMLEIFDRDYARR